MHQLWQLYCEQKTKTSVEKSINNELDISGRNCNDDIDIPATIEEEKDGDKGDDGGVVEEVEVVHNYYLRSSRYNEYSLSGSESSGSDSNSDSDYRETDDEDDTFKAPIVSKRENEAGVVYDIEEGDIVQCANCKYCQS